MSNGGIDRLSKIGKELYLKPDKADVYFVIGSTNVGSTDERVPAHKILLSSASTVFDAMFYGLLKEQGDIQIVDASSDAFKEFLQFFYINKVVLTIDNISQVMYLVQKYNVVDCLSLCADFLTTEISIENVTVVLDLALIYEQKQLREFCEIHISLYSSEVLRSPDFVKCNRQVLHHIVNMDYLSCNETEVFEACMAWVKVASEQEKLTGDIIRTHLGEIFYQIRFRSMPQHKFAELLPSYGDLFSAAEYQEIFQVMSKPEFIPKMFTGLRRLSGDVQQAWDKNLEISCNRREEEESLHPIQMEEVTTFTTNTALLFGYFELDILYNSDGARIDYIRNVRATIFANSSELQSFTFNYDKFSYKVKIPNPVTIKPKIIYKLQLTFPSNDFFTKASFNSIATLTDDIVIKFHDDRYENGHIVGVIDVFWFNLLN